MIAYIINMSLCALLLYVIYVLLLESENRHRFKRIYLLVSLVFSMLVPFIVFEANVTQMPATLEMLYNKQPLETVMSGEGRLFMTETTALSKNFTRLNYMPVWTVYLIITSLFLFRFVRNCRRLIMQARNNKNVNYRGAKIVLINEKVRPHSFGRYIFINSDDYDSGLVPDEIIVHEWVHVRQRHTYDILFIELLITLGWFNPVFYLYRNKIRQNHEFLADYAVVRRENAIISDYVTILINYISQNKKIGFTSYFNYLITKKRLIMITKTTSKKRAWCSSLALIPVFITAIFIFSTKTIAQQDAVVPSEQPNESVEISMQDNTQTATPALPRDKKTADLLKDSVFAARYREYNQIIANHTVEIGKDGKKGIKMDAFTKEDFDRMIALYQAMSPEQQSIISLVPQRRKWVDENIPTKEQVESWKVPSEYGVWLDGKRIENSELDRYQPSDFSCYFVSRLARNAKNYGLHVYQLDLYSTAYYKKIKAEWEADETLYLMPNTQRN